MNPGILSTSFGQFDEAREVITRYDALKQTREVSAWVGRHVSGCDTLH